MSGNTKNRKSNTGAGSADDALLGEALRKYKSVLLPVDEKADAEDVERLMQLTARLRKAHQKPGVLLFFSRPHSWLAMAATLLLLCGVSWLLLFSDRVHMAPNHQEQQETAHISTPLMAVNTLGVVGMLPVFRDVVHRDRPLKLYYEQAVPIAYLFSGTMAVTVSRDGVDPQVIGTTCVVLQEADRIDVSGTGVSVILYERHVVIIETPGGYTVGANGVVRAIGGGESPGVLAIEPGLIMPPAELLRLAPIDHAAQKPNGDEIPILSPRGNMLTQAPQFIFAGDERLIKHLDVARSNEVGYPETFRVETRDLVREGALAWEQTGLPVFPRGTDWIATLWSNKGKIGSGQFKIVSEADARIIEASIARIHGLIPAGPARNFAEANALLLGNIPCPAEARNRMRFAGADPRSRGNVIYLSFVHRCFNNLDMSDLAHSTRETIEQCIAQAHRESAAYREKTEKPK